MARPEALGEQYQASLTRAERRRRGAFYTPEALAAEVAEATLRPLLDHTPADRIRVCDPAVGCGALLLAAARLLMAAGGDPRAVAGNMTGTDIDPTAADLARVALTLLTGWPAQGIAVGDALLDPPAGPFDAVVTNPPFLGQLKSGTARDRETAAALLARFGDAARAYADSAGLFTMASLELVRPGGRVGIVLPEPVVATRDGAGARRWVGERSQLDRMWAAPPGAFDAGVRARVAVFARGAAGPAAWAAGEWAALAGGGTPDVDPAAGGRLGDVARATADFRDQYYGVAEVVVDAAEDGTGPRLITCGLIDPARHRWGERPARLARRRYLHPRAAVDRLGPQLRAWADRQAMPKVLLATQTRILEAVADEDGSLLPVVPVITVTPDGVDLWSVLAVLLAPPVAALARRRHAGAALSPDAIKLSARQVAELPLPVDAGAWAAGARAAEAASRAGDDASWRAALDRLGASMCAAYRVPEADVLPWWSERLARRAA